MKTSRGPIWVLVSLVSFSFVAGAQAQRQEAREAREDWPSKAKSSLRAELESPQVGERAGLSVPRGHRCASADQVQRDAEGSSGQAAQWDCRCHLRPVQRGGGRSPAVAGDAERGRGRPRTVRYQFVNAMLLNEVQKQRSTIARQQAEIQDLAARLAKLEALVAAGRGTSVVFAESDSAGWRAGTALKQ